LHGNAVYQGVSFVVEVLFPELTIWLVELAESVEFKSLPSGLHNVEEDLVYVGLVAYMWTVH